MWIAITLLVAVWVLSVVVAFLFGRYMYKVDRRIAELEQVVKSKVDKEPEVEQPKSELIDPTDPIANAIYEHEQMQKKLNQNG